MLHAPISKDRGKVVFEVMHIFVSRGQAALNDSQTTLFAPQQHVRLSTNEII